jgi:predicted PurR-regulated permease PerM
MPHKVELSLSAVKMKDLKTTNTLLLILVVPLVFYILKTLSFIFVPLIFAMFIALMFLPLMRWLRRKRVPKIVSIGIVMLIIFLVFRVSASLISISGNEIRSAGPELKIKAETKITEAMLWAENSFSLQRPSDQEAIPFYLGELHIMNNLGPVLGMLNKTLTMILMTAFFIVLFLAESVNVEKILKDRIFKSKFSSVKTFNRIEMDIVKFFKVKIIISLFTGVGFTLACMAFDVSFPIFWGLFAFLINFVQMVGSVISVVLLGIFAFIELDYNTILLFFVLTITAVQVFMGGILEPIFLGKTFSINVITVLIMLMFWGFLWGVPGLIMSIPITVFLKITFEQFDRTRAIAVLMDGGKGD